MNVFFLKQVISALMIVVNILYFSSINRFLFTCMFNWPVYDALAPWQKKNYERLILTFLQIPSFCKPFPHISFSNRNLIYVYFKKHFPLYVERLGHDFAAMLVTFVFISYFASQDIFLISQGNKKLTKLVYFLETTKYECSII